MLHDTCPILIGCWLSALTPCTKLPPPRAEGSEGGEGGGDPRAALVLQLLLASLEQPAPNLAHLLCGFDFDAGKCGLQEVADSCSCVACIGLAALPQSQAASQPTA